MYNSASCEFVDYSGMTLKVSHIAKSYGEHKILADAALEALGGRLSVLMGTNGSGRTTLFNIISGYTQQDSGAILFDGVEMTKYKHYLRKRLGIGRTFQDMRLIGNLTVKENVMLAFPEQQGKHVLYLAKLLKTRTAFLGIWIFLDFFHYRTKSNDRFGLKTVWKFCRCILGRGGSKLIRITNKQWKYSF